MNIYVRAFLFVCIVFIPFISYAQSIETQAQKEARLQQELEQVLKEQAETESILKNAQTQTVSIQRDILILNTKIKAAQLNIKAKTLLIETLGKDINKKQNLINSLEDRIDTGRETLAQIIRKTNEMGTLSLPEFILKKGSLTDILSDLDTFESMQSSLKTTFEEIRNDKQQTESEKDALDKRKNGEIDARAVIVTEKKNIELDESEKQKLLKISKNNEKAYAQVLADKKVKAAQIRAALFSLRDTAAIPFEKALEYANKASQMTGIRPAFLLAILTQESSLGKNVGACYLSDINTGAGISVRTNSILSNVMKPGRDIPPFLSITKSLGLDPLKTLVSCPQSVGWGGAMGPAQFIASTWVLLNDRVARALNISMPNPWAPQDAFMASAFFLTDLGASSASYTSEKNAACRYYSGKKCSASSISNSYGTSVMAHADNIQRTMIDPLQGI